MDTVLDGGFADPILQSQTAFRAIMDALANPGTCQDLVIAQPSSLSMSAELVSTLLTLSDHDTLIWLDKGLARDNAVSAFIGFHAGAPITAEPGRAAFAFASAAETLPALDQFNLGTQEYPDRSTTIVLVVPSLTGGETLVLRGPGIRDHIHISPTGLPGDFVAQWAANREIFPRGIDLLLVADGQVMGLPRTTAITQGH